MSLSDAADTGNGVAVIDSLLHPQALFIRAALSRQSQSAGSEFIVIDDEENILRAMAAGIVIRSLYYSGEAAISAGLRRNLARTIPRFEIGRRTCKKLFENDKTSRLFAIAEAPVPKRFEALSRPGKDIVVLDSISIAGNIGAIVRTSAAMSAGGIAILGTQPVNIFDRRIIRASRGHVFSLPIVATTMGELIQGCVAHDISLVATTPQSDNTLHGVSSLPHPVAWAFGGEKHGCSSALVAAAKFRVGIPMNSKVESLNVAAVAAIALHCRYAFNSSPCMPRPRQSG